MSVLEIWPYVAVIPIISSVVFFFLAKEHSIWNRLYASAHGWAALAIYPFAVLMLTQHPGLRVAVGLPVILILGGVSSVSVFYSMATVRCRWVYHLMHAATLFIIALSVVFSLFILAEHH
ncbi:MAG: hypothetical protein WBN07_13870 [Woeseiaceae bacterium]|jgi:hypothetical protein